MLSVRRALFLLLCALALPVGAANVWVDLTGTGAGAANGSSYADRCAGVSDTDCFSAGVKPAAGSTVYLCGAGTAAMTNTNSGAAGNLIVYDGSCPGGAAGSITVGAAIGITSSNRNYVTFKNLSVVAQQASFFGYGTNLTFDNVDFSGATGTNPIISFQASQTSGTVTITNSKIHNGASHCIAYQPTGGSLTLGPFTVSANTIYSCGGSGIQFQTATPGWTTTVWNEITVSNNTIYDTATPINIRSGIPTIESPTDYDGCRDTNLDGVVDTPAYSRSVIVSSNTIYNSTSNGLNFHCLNGGSVHDNLIHDVFSTGAGINFAGDQGSIVYSNEVYNVTASNGIDEHAYYADRFSDATQFLRNKCHDIDGVTGQTFTGGCIALFKATNTLSVANLGWSLKNGIVFNHSLTTGNKAYNNTFSVTSTGILAPNTGVGTAAAGLSVIDNVLIAPTCANVETNQSTWNFNSCRGTYVTQVSGGSDITTNPLLDSNYRPLPGSPLIGAGTVVGPYHDYRNCRLSEPPTIGAYERCAGDWAGTRSLSVSLTQAASRTPAGAR